MDVNDIEFLEQLIKSLEDSEIKLEESYKKGDGIGFSNTKKFMIKIYTQIKEAVRE